MIDPRPRGRVRIRAGASRHGRVSAEHEGSSGNINYEPNGDDLWPLQLDDGQLLRVHRFDVDEEPGVRRARQRREARALAATPESRALRLQADRQLRESMRELVTRLRLARGVT